MNRTTSQQSHWDYSALAHTYENRANYAKQAISYIAAAVAHRTSGAPVWAVDIGAGTGKLTRELLSAQIEVVAAEPNIEMLRVAAGIRENGRAHWVRAKAEALPIASNRFTLASFGSSFNVVDTQRALEEANRVLGNTGVLVILWNHRDRNDPLQIRIESTIRAVIPNYVADSRRFDPQPEIEAHGGFELCESHRIPFVQATTRETFIDAWRSHGTLARSAGMQFQEAIAAISSQIVESAFDVPFETSLWIFRKRGLRK